MTQREKERAKSILYKWSSSKILLEYEQEEINRINDIISSMADVSAMVYSHLPKSKDVSSPVERCVIRSLKLCEDRIDRINKRIQTFIAEENKINDILDDMDFDKSFILKGKYAKRWSWDQIRGEYPYDMCLRNFYRIHSEALEEFYEKYKNMN